MYDLDSSVELLLQPAAALSKGDDNIWRRHHFVWKQPETWVPQLTAWLLPHFRRDGFRRLKPGRFRDLCWDDFEWRNVLGRCLLADIDYHTDQLADVLDRATLRTYHGCRTDDAGSYFREGLLVHDRAHMTARLRSIVEQNQELNWFAPRLDAAIAEIDNTLDIGRLYVVAEDTFLLKHAAHYLIYGSEWIAAVLGSTERKVLLKSGAPTLLEIDLPLRVATPGTLRELSAKLLAEWTRRACNQPDWHAPIDFSFCLRTDIPPDWIVDHSHPAELNDPLEQRRLYKAAVAGCAYCSPAPE